LFLTTAEAARCFLRDNVYSRAVRLACASLLWCPIQTTGPISATAIPGNQLRRNIFRHDTASPAMDGCVPRDLGVDGSTHTAPSFTQGIRRYAHISRAAVPGLRFDPGTQVFLAIPALAPRRCHTEFAGDCTTGQITEDVELFSPRAQPGRRFVIFTRAITTYGASTPAVPPASISPPSKRWSPSPVNCSPANAEVLEARSAPVGRYVAFVSSRQTTLVPRRPDTGVSG